MNIFFVDNDPNKAAQALCDKHVVKMILESAQMLSTAQHVLGYGMYSKAEDFYRKAYTNHPCNVWIRECVGNYRWLLNHASALCWEYEFRYGKKHKSGKIIQNACCYPIFPKDSSFDITPPAQAMPDEYKDSDPVVAYRRYYIEDKMKNIDCRWTKRKEPEWLSQ